jgi:ABC-type branched-subunit amino acid transport system substrate-binding protein
MKRVLTGAGGVVLAAALVGGYAGLAATVSGASPSGKKSTLTVATIEAFSGQLAAFGPPNYAGCLAGAAAVDAEGGVLGHKVACKAVNDTGDPADAVPAVDQLLTSTSSLVFTIGPGATASAVTPVLEAAHIPEFSLSGTPQYNKNTSRYFYRLLPADSDTGAAMAYYAIQHGWKTANEVFTATGASTVGTGLVPEYKKLGGHILKDETITPDQPSYHAQVSAALSTHPQVIFSESDPQTAATFWSEAVQQQSNLPPIIGDTADTYSTFTKAVLPLVGKHYHLVAVGQATPAPSPGLSVYKSELKKISGVKQPTQYATSSFSIADYDGVVLGALAMVAAHSTNPVVFSKYFHDITAKPGAGIPVVHTFAQGVTALKKHKKIAYDGATGQIVLDKHNNFAAPFVGLNLNDATGKFTATGKPIPESALRH